MADKPSGASGQQKLHNVRDADGNVTQMTQEEWRKRDKSAGLVRVDEQGTELPDDEPSDEPPPASGGTTQ